MVKRIKEKIFQAFEDRRTLALVSVLCLVYFIFYFSPDTGFVAKILPVWPLKVFLGIASFVMVAQVLGWKLMRHFQSNWHKDLSIWLMFWCEYILALFTVLFFSWPVYFLVQAIQESKHRF